VFFTRVAYASPSRGLALRHCLHGSPRLILAVLARAFALPKALRRCVPTEGGHPCRPAQHLLQPTALSLRFSITPCADRSWRLTPLYSSGGRLSFSVSPLLLPFLAHPPPWKNICSLQHLDSVI
jgi:hypothetical protein